MSYRCKLCGEAQPNGERCFVTPVRKRPKEYTFFDKKKKRTRKTKGWEIEVEAKLCARCYSLSVLSKPEVGGEQNGKTH